MQHFKNQMWRNQWYNFVPQLCSDESKVCRSPMTIAEAWRRGYTGRGVVVSVLDDGMDGEHPDLKPNYDPLASFDVNGQHRHPSPSYYETTANYHGTWCAGIVAAANYSPCTKGVAFRARIGGVRMLDGLEEEVTDIVEAQALSFKPQHVDVYLASWGPEDDGATVDGPGPLTRLALQNGIETGRHGRGSVYVWPTGNGGQKGDHCSCDGYSNSIYTISISSSIQRRNGADYQERCSSTLATASTAEEIPVLAPQQSCSTAKSGSALSVSMAAGVIALALEANPLLTWRDVQHIIVLTSDARRLVAADWRKNGAGHKVSHLYGFGLLDAESMVLQAKRWRRVPSQLMCVVEAPAHLNRIIPAGPVLTSVLETAGGSRTSKQHVRYVEHVVVRVTVACSRRGDLSITLTSPSGTVSQLLDKRPHDNSTEGFHKWEFMTTHCWGEQAAGEWTLKIRDSPSEGRENWETGMLKDWSLVIYGTAEPPYPVHRRRTRSDEMPKDEDFTEEYTGPCDPECSDDGCEGPSPRQCVMCSHFFLKFKNNTWMCVSECPRGFWGDRRRCKRCYSSCESCTGSRSNQCTSCQPGSHLTEGTNTCTAICQEDYYLDHDANMCRKCSENCLRCTSSSVCTECKADTSLRGNRCQRSCAPGFYHDEGEGLCKACHRVCAACAGAGVEACTQCAQGYLMEEWRCVPSCSSGFFATEPNREIADGHRMCRRCDASCLTCIGPSQANCSSCSSGHSLQEGECVLNTACADAEYQDINGQCHPCHPTCQKCTGPQKWECISCFASRALDEGHCLTECARGKYQLGGRCHLCDHTCATCVEAGLANCTSCDTDKFGMERYLHGDRCVDTCPEAFYHTKERSCEPCSDNCRLCTSSVHCLKCNSSYYVSEGACAKLECGEGEVEDPDYSDCMACEEGCRQCVLYNPRHCLSCKEGFYNFQDGCYKNCPAKTYSVEYEMTCIPCDDNCVSCDQHECYWCETDLFLSEGKCVSVCPDGYYGDEDTNDCEECHADCVSCSGPDIDDCESCEEGKTLEIGQCVSSDAVCPFGTFRNDDGECVDCHPSCESCSGEDKNQCTKCAEGHFLGPQQTCVSKCPGAFFGGRLSGECELCPAGCLHCVDSERCTRCLSHPRAAFFLQDGQCVQQCVRGYPAGQVCRSCTVGCASCENNSTYCLSCEEPLLLQNHQCVDRCPLGHTVQAHKCHRCPPACDECSPLEECTACEEYHFLHEGLCVADCPDSFFSDNERRECLRCHPDCDLCDGPNDNDCDACVDPGAILYNGACVPACPSHTFMDAATGECKDCDASCFTCVGPLADSCSSCKEGRRLEEGQGRCVPSADECSPHQYPDKRGECHPCHKYCHGCSGPGKSHCLSCKQRHLLLNGTCVDQCPPGLYADDLRHKCVPCHPSCQSCVGKHGHECQTCKDHLFRDGKECVETCRHSHYGNTASRECEPCDPSCAECSGGGAGGCLSCALGLVYLQREGRCLASCPQGFYEDAGNAACKLCHASCASCSGKSSHSCDSCRPGYLLSGGTCVSVCDTDRYPLIKGSSHTCEDCDSSCLQCRGPGPANCTLCPAQAILEAGGRCLLCCRHEDDEGAVTRKVQDCCNCTETRGECVLSTNLAFRNEEEEEARGNLVVFIIACVLLVAALVAAIFLIQHSRSKRAPSDAAPRGYEKLGSGGGHTSSSSSASYGGRYKDTQLVDFRERYSAGKDDDDDDDEEDIVYMSQDGTVYRKFRYGHLGEDEDDLEYDDESYTYR
ncbi:proprotein convertase subtilisin/kexin type 5 isoform X1 [Dunckerocampus dactyliophorus]|uniref:proprotein convertase subtilisin/kexin type 5 isoform X1 n=2 Tax=Dunckerocampus dactyliophorus TaxID=161453 RepID=UPI0024058FD0|nr:proprotein convertase subtilisin/kexin type 5 isoform X1 [Dunckerocampus dactyliophorus]XP_054613482.1 proprotein convertase subtilisin/kexin type 5 isoform X1 [Dunckerocampus dactyliophorus]XP_054613484.1 proprotein convertase subtilisin/kexin type 5 isoform X1 [Dunckerocampus dactyliophorus]